MKKKKIHTHGRPKVLVVDDEDIIVDLLKSILEEECRVVGLTDGRQVFKEACKKPQPALILLDVTLSSMSGIDICKKIKKDPETKSIPVIFLASNGEEDGEIKAFEAGAVDYISKPIRKAIVLARIKLHLELKRERDFYAQRSLIDGLTEVPNRRRLMEHLDHELRRAKRNKIPLSLIMLDIDFFKSFNDNYGHLEGDEALKLVAEMAYQKMKRPNDLVGRYGGEEFVCVLPDTDAAGTEEMCRILLEAISALQIPHEFSEISDVLTISLGGITTVPTQKTTSEELLKSADDLLYQAKSSGRNCYKCNTL